MRHILLYQGTCHACSGVARLVRELETTGLTALPFQHPEVTGLLAGAGLRPPDRPALLVVDGTTTRLLTGWAMRRRLARLVGWRRAGTVVRLLTAEWRARVVRAAGSGTPSRRTVIGGLLAGLGGLTGWAVLRGPAHEVSAERPVLTPADPAHVTAVLATAPARQAVRTFGPVQTVAHQVGTEVLMFTHTRPGFFTFVDDSPAALGTGNPTALSLQMSTDGESAIRYFTTGGLPLAQLTLSPDGGVSAGPVPDSAAVLTSVTTGEPEVPEISRKLECFIGCIGARASAQCLSGCLGCFNPMPAPQKAVCFAACAACAGPHGLGCAAECAQV